MNWDQVEGKWKQYKGQFREKWGKPTDDDLDRVAGKRDQLVGRIQERYGIEREQAQEEADEFLRNIREDASTTQEDVQSTRISAQRAGKS